MSNEHESCQKRYSDKIIDELSRDIKEIKECLIGSLEKQGWISKMSERITKVEDKLKYLNWLIGLIISVVIAGSFKIFFDK